jgi:hypothetical protein
LRCGDYWIWQIGFVKLERGLREESMAKRAAGGVKKSPGKPRADTSGRPVFTGIVKEAANKKSLMIARVGDTSHWVTVPNGHIHAVRDVEPSQSSPGSGHRVANVTLKPPRSAEAKTFAAMAQLHSAPAGPPGSTDMCWDSVQQKWIPCPKGA